MSSRRLFMITTMMMAGRGAAWGRTGATHHTMAFSGASFSSMSSSSPLSLRPTRPGIERGRDAGHHSRRRSVSTRMQQPPQEGGGGAVPALNGFLAVNKPEGWTSNDIVTKLRCVLEKSVRQIVGRKVNVKVGHGGTLDPMATGVLVLGIGSGCKAMQEYLKGSKAYKAVALLGTEYDTLDRTGTPIETVDVSHVTTAMLEEALKGFRGEIMQRPPAFSAIRKGGKRLYELARKGEMVEAEPRPVVVEHLSLVPGHELPEFGLDVACQGGTYVRSLISDIARTVNARAHMTALVRTQQGPFHLHQCLDSEHWNDFDRLLVHLEACNSIVAKAEGASGKGATAAA